VLAKVTFVVLSTIALIAVAIPAVRTDHGTGAHIAAAPIPTADPRDLYRLALDQHHRIAADADHETRARAEAARIAADLDREQQARAEADRIASETRQYLAAIAAAEAERQRALAVAELQRQQALRQTTAVATQAPRQQAVSAPVATTAPVTRQAPSAPTGALTGQALRDAALAAGWPAALIPGVERRVACESGGYTTAVGPLGHQGLMQVAPWYHGAVPSDAVGQLAQAYRVYQQQGWAAWECQ